MNATGTTSILSGGTMILSGSNRTLVERTINNPGTVTWTAGQISTHDDALIVNTGTTGTYRPTQTSSTLRE